MTLSCSWKGQARDRRRQATRGPVCRVLGELHPKVEVNPHAITLLKRFNYQTASARRAAAKSPPP